MSGGIATEILNYTFGKGCKGAPLIPRGGRGGGIKASPKTWKRERAFGEMGGGRGRD